MSAAFRARALLSLLMRLRCARGDVAPAQARPVVSAATAGGNPAAAQRGVRQFLAARLTP